MIIRLRPSQYYFIRESLKNEKVICEKCKWSWKLSEGGDDPYTCHKCGHINKK